MRKKGREGGRDRKKDEGEREGVNREKKVRNK